MTKSLNKYKPVTGVVYNGTPITDKAMVLKLIMGGKKIEIMSWASGDILFYINTDNMDIVYPNDVTYMYMIDGTPVTALELIKTAKSHGFFGNDTNRASLHLTNKGFKVKNNPNPTNKFNVSRNH